VYDLGSVASGCLVQGFGWGIFWTQFPDVYFYRDCFQQDNHLGGCEHSSKKQVYTYKHPIIKPACARIEV
jgi:hypothetical protein